MNTVEEESSNASISFHEYELTSSTPPLDKKIEPGENENCENSAHKKKILYELSADAVCVFGNGESIKVSKTLLAYYSTVFTDIFFGESPTATLMIEDFDCETFQTFLDCLFGFKEYKVLDALLIYSIARKYEVAESLKNCVKVLLPDKMDENVCITLNLATFYKDMKLEDKVISFLRDDVGFFNLLENESYRNLLEPLAVSRIIQEAEMNSYLWTVIYEWGKFYLKKHSKPGNSVRFLFEENDIFPKLSLTDFESVSSILDFHDFTHKELLDSDEILNFLKENIKTKILPDESEWVKIKKGDAITENIKFVSPVRLPRNVKERNLVSTNNIYCDKSKNVLCYMSQFYRTSSQSFEPPIQTKRIAMLKDIVSKKNEKKFSLNFHLIEEEYDILGAKITYEFLSDCMILKAPLNNNFICDQLCFTNNWTCQVLKKNG